MIMGASHIDLSSSKKPSSRLLVIIGLVVVCCAAGGFILFWSFSSDNNQQEINEVLDRRAAALRQKDIDQYLSCFSQQYRSNTQTYNDLRASASKWFTNFATIRFSFHVLDIDIQGDKAIVENTYTFFLTSGDDESIDISREELLELRREQYGWKIFSARSIR